jgi:pimeloyl-ACP methyl ester carboxylesterase
VSIAGAPSQYALDSAQLASAREWYLNVGDRCRLYVREFGVGDTVVVLHGGWGAEHSYLLTPFRGLEDDYHLVFYDQRGSLRSPCPDSLVSVDAHVADLERLRVQLGQERLTLAGHSMGTWLAMKYLEVHPEHVGGMVLLDALVPRIGADDAGLYGEEQKAFNDWRSDSTRVQDELAAEGLDRPDSLLSDIELTDKWRIYFANSNIFHIERWRQMEGGQVFYDQGAGSAAGRSMNANAGWDFLDDLAAHPYPVTVLIGDHDLVGFGGGLHRSQLTPLENTTFVMLENAGHNSWVDRPAAFRAALVAGLERAVAASPGKPD